MSGLYPCCSYQRGQLFMIDTSNLLSECSVGINDFSIGNYIVIYPTTMRGQETSVILYQWEYHGRHALTEMVAMQQ